jgi:hypothetical protein
MQWIRGAPVAPYTNSIQTRRGPLWVIRVGLSVRPRLPLWPRNPTYCCVAANGRRAKVRSINKASESSLMAGTKYQILSTSVHARPGVSAFATRKPIAMPAMRQ